MGEGAKTDALSEAARSAILEVWLGIATMRVHFRWILYRDGMDFDVQIVMPEKGNVIICRMHPNWDAIADCYDIAVIACAGSIIAVLSVVHGKKSIGHMYAAAVIFVFSLIVSSVYATKFDGEVSVKMHSNGYWAFWTQP